MLRFEVSEKLFGRQNSILTKQQCVTWSIHISAEQCIVVTGKVEAIKIFLTTSIAVHKSEYLMLMYSRRKK